MERNKRRLYRTFLILMQLEDRAQPGTLLTAGIDSGTLAEVNDQPHQQTAKSAIRRFKATEDIQNFSSPLDGAQILTAPITASAPSSTNKTQQVDQNGINPALLLPAQQPFRRTEEFTVGGRTMNRTHATFEAAPTPEVTLGAGPIGYFSEGNTSRTLGTAAADGSTDDGGGTRATVWAHYDTSTISSGNISGGSDRTDRVNDVAVSAEPNCADHTITGGVIGRNGTIRYYSPTGAFVRQLEHAPGGRPANRD